MSVVHKINYSIFKIDILCFLEQLETRECDGSRCGCFKKHCWAYVNGDYATQGDCWCYTQKEGAENNGSMWQTCTQDLDCHWGQSCGNGTKYKGKEESIQTVCDNEGISSSY